MSESRKLHHPGPPAGRPNEDYGGNGSHAPELPRTSDIMHPSMIHFAILLLLFSPLFIVVGGVLTPLRGRASVAIVFMSFLLGTASVLVAMDWSRETVQPSCVPSVQTTSLAAV